MINRLDMKWLFSIWAHVPMTRLYDRASAPNIMITVRKLNRDRFSTASSTLHAIQIYHFDYKIWKRFFFNRPTGWLPTHHDFNFVFWYPLVDRTQPMSASNNRFWIITYMIEMKARTHDGTTHTCMLVYHDLKTTQTSGNKQKLVISTSWHQWQKVHHDTTIYPQKAIT